MFESHTHPPGGKKVHNIEEKVTTSINKLIKEFELESTLFYTENDLVCRFYSILQEELAYYKAKDVNGYCHYLVHREYPTPFRCDMSGSRFEVKGDDDRTPKGGKYRRGHYDIVVLNPEFIEKFDYEIVKGQNYSLVRRNFQYPVIYGVEFAFNRYSKTKRSVERFIDLVIQDYRKLEESKSLGFVKNVAVLVFDNTSSAVQRRVVEKLGAYDEIVFGFGRAERVY